MGFKKSKLFNSIKTIQNKSFFNYALSYGVFCLFISSFYYYLSDFDFNVVRIIFVFIIFIFPLVFIFILFYAKNVKEEYSVFGISMIIYFLIFFIFHIFFNPDKISFWQIPLAFFTYNALPLFCIFLFRIKKIKSISITLFTFCFVSILISNSLVSILSGNDDLLSLTSDIISDMGFKGLLHVIIYFFLLILIGLLTAWIILMLFKYLYKRKVITAIQLTVDAYLLIFSISYALFLMVNNSYVLLSVIIAFIVYKVFEYILFRINKPVESLNINLLFLRVFALKEKTVSLFTAIETYWRFAGSTQLISGPDMAATTVEPHELISYLNGQLKKSFCDTGQRIEENISSMHVQSNFDFTHSVNEFFCRENTWKDVLVKLVSKSEIVIMDLRSFSERYKGCLYEIQQLVNYMPLNKCLFITDKETNIPFAKYAFEYCFYYLSVDSPNFKSDHSYVNFYELDNINRSTIGSLMNVICSVSDSIHP